MKPILKLIIEPNPDEAAVNITQKDYTTIKSSEFKIRSLERIANGRQSILKITNQFIDIIFLMENSPASSQFLSRVISVINLSNVFTIT
jgi:hypothetical protein